jgi:excisionase family DNA binding protein
MMQTNLTIREAAIQLGVTLQYAYGLAQTGRLPGAFKKDGRWLVPQTAINDRLKKRRQLNEARAAA